MQARILISVGSMANLYHLCLIFFFFKCMTIFYFIRNHQSSQEISSMYSQQWIDTPYMANKGAQPHIYKYPCSPQGPSHAGCHTTLTEFSVLCSRTLLVIPFKYRSVYPCTFPNPLTIPSRHPSRLATTRSFSKSLSPFLFCK